MERLLNYLIVAEHSQALLLVFIMMAMKKNRRANIFLALFLLVISSNFFFMMLARKGVLSFPVAFGLFSQPALATAGSLLYLYTIFMTGMERRFVFRHLIHFSMGIFLLLLFLLGYFSEAFEETGHRFIRIGVTLLGVALVTSLTYVGYSLIRLRAYSRKVEYFFSDLDRKSLSWLNKLTVVSLLLLVVWNGEFWLALSGTIHRNPFNLVINSTLVMLVIFFTAYHLVNQPEVFRKNLEMQEILSEEDRTEDKEKYTRQNIDEVKMHDYLVRLKSYIETYKPYLHENITIKELSEKVGIPYHHLSIVINSMLKKNFYTFINEYRIEEAITIMKEPGNEDASVLSIAFRSGFNSKSSFNNVFKKITGHTPSEFRKNLTTTSMLAS